MFLWLAVFSAFLNFDAVAAAASSGSAGESFGYDDLVRSIKSHHVITLEEALPLFPESMRANYTLMAESRSLQSASPENPRAILFGVDGKFSCSFNGNRFQRGYESLECIQFRDAERIFDFRTIEFPYDQPRRGIRFSQNQAANGESKCTGCHTADARPSWNEFHFWTGAYGENDDRLEPSAAEDYQKFAKLRESNPRYRFLGALDFSNRPNRRFSDLTNKWNAFRLARVLSKLPKRKQVAYALGAFQCAKTPNPETQRILQPYLQELNPVEIAAASGLSPVEWSTQVFSDSRRSPDYLPVAGFTDLVTAVGMVITQDLARAGNLPLQNGIRELLVLNAESAQEISYLTVLNQITPEFGKWSAPKAEALCPELARVFVH